ncbi:phosphonate C-P lyase system protein PhnG [Bradyrhizobium valentinum]|nr:phosphonate C-P lyase system protein PhnG [Bradyrhizobium valentinum]
MTLANKNRQPADATKAARSDWLGILSRSRAVDLAALAADIVAAETFEWLRPPEVGLVMVRARAGGSGRRFNLGEMTVTRASVRLSNGTIGTGYVQGRDKEQAQRVAILDALLQAENRHAEIMTAVIEPLREKHSTMRREMSRKAAATKVEFFTMVRGENPQ